MRAHSPCHSCAQVPTKPEAAKKGGWGDSPGGAGSGDGDGEQRAPMGRRRRGAADDEEEGGADEPKQTSQIASMDDDDGNVAFIPDLEDEEEDLGKQVAVAQNYQRQLPTLMELEEELDMQLPSTAEVGIDLSVLQSFLTPQEMCQEEDVPWDIDFELQTIASEMQKELEQREGKALPGEIKKVGGGVSKKEGGGAAAATGGGVERKRGGGSKAKDDPADLS